MILNCTLLRANWFYNDKLDAFKLLAISVGRRLLRHPLLVDCLSGLHVGDYLGKAERLRLVGRDEAVVVPAVGLVVLPFGPSRDPPPYPLQVRVLGRRRDGDASSDRPTGSRALMQLEPSI